MARIRILKKMFHKNSCHTMSRELFLFHKNVWEGLIGK
jgi:hypothetical protein